MINIAITAFAAAMTIASFHHLREFIRRERRMKQLLQEVARAGAFDADEFHTSYVTAELCVSKGVSMLSAPKLTRSSQRLSQYSQQ